MGEHAPASATKIIQGYVSGSRKVLGHGLLITRASGYLLQVGRGRLDIDQFMRTERRARVSAGNQAQPSADPLADPNRGLTTKSTTCWL